MYMKTVSGVLYVGYNEELTGGAQVGRSQLSLGVSRALDAVDPAYIR
jgi:hypothetical protein